MSFVRSMGLGVALGLSACSGMPSDLDGGVDAGFDAGVDAGPPAIKYTRFTRRSDGFPANARVKGAAAIDNVLYVATDLGLVALPNTNTKWDPVTSPLMGDEKPTSFQRIDQSLVMTSAGASTGGLWVKPYDGAWAKVMNAPPNPAWGLYKKSNEWLLVTTGGLYAATALNGPWARRSPMNSTLFATPVTRFAAAPAQQKMFAANEGGALFESADLGASWTASAPRGPVEALAAGGAVVLVATGMDGQQRSDNYGNTFRAATMPLASGVLTYVAQGSQFWAGSNGGLFTSTDLGVTFTEDSDGLAPGTSVRGLFFAQGYVVADTPDGVFINQI